VTILTNIGGCDVVERLTSGRDTVMAVATTLGFNILMIKVGRYPAGGTMTVITLCRGRQVIQILAHGSNTIMTTAAGAQHLVL